MKANKIKRFCTLAAGIVLFVIMSGSFGALSNATLTDNGWDNSPDIAENRSRFSENPMGKHPAPRYPQPEGQLSDRVGAEGTPILSASDVNLTRVGHIGGVTYTAEVSGNYAYIGRGSDFVVLDITNKIAPIEIGVFRTTDTIFDIAVNGNYAYLADWSNGLVILDITNRASPVLKGSYDSVGWSNGVEVAGNYAYLADGYNGILILDISNPASPVLKSRYYTSGAALDIAVAGNYVYVAENDYRYGPDYDTGLEILDVTNPTTPVFKGSYDTAGYSWGVAVAGSYAYLADDENGLVILDISNPASPVLKGSYDTAGHSYDVGVAGNYAYLVDWNNGFIVLDVSNPTSPILKGSYDTEGYSFDLDVAGNYAYIADWNNGLVILDLSNPASPIFKKNYDTSFYSYSVAVAGNYAYVADIYEDFVVVDISNPTSAVFKGSYNTAGSPYDVTAVGNYAYVADYNNGLVILDVSNPMTPVLKGSYNTAGYSYGVAVAGNYAYVADYNNGLVIFDKSNPVSPVLKGSYNTAGYSYGVAVAGNYAYVADYNNGLVILDVSNPVSPILKGSYNTAGYSYDVAVAGSYAYIADYDKGLVILDVSNPALPVLKGTYDTPGYSYDVAVAGNYVYVADSLNGLLALDVSNPASPVLKGSYRSYSNIAYHGIAGVAVAGNYVYAADSDYGLEILRIDEPPNRPPVITSITANPSSVIQSGSSTITIVASDPDGDALSYSYNPGGGTISGSGSVVTWTAPAINGTFRVYVTVSDGKNDTRGSVGVTVTAENKPDLIIQDITWPSPDPNKGDNVPVTVTVKNAGKAGAVASHVGLFIGGIKVGSLPVESLAAGAAVSKTFTWTADSCGSTGVSAMANVDKEVGESREDNNNMDALINVKCPDLIITDISWKNQSDGSEIQPGDEVSFFYTIKNQGSADTPDEFNTFLYIDSERWDISARGSLAAGQSQDRYFTRTWQAAGGSHSIKVVADGYGEIDEGINEKNNEMWKSVLVGVEPMNLTITGIEVTQGIQSLNNDVPLIEGKHTVVRVYLKTNSNKGVNKIAAILKVYRNSNVIGEIRNQEIVFIPPFIDGEIRPNIFERRDISNGLIFELDDSWLYGEITVKVEILQDPRFNLEKLCNTNCEIKINFNKVDKLNLVFIPIYHKPSGKKPNMAEFFNELEDFVDLYPLTKRDIIVEPWDPQVINYNPTNDESKECDILLWHVKCSDQLISDLKSNEKYQKRTDKFIAYGLVDKFLKYDEPNKGNILGNGQSPDEMKIFNKKIAWGIPSLSGHQRSIMAHEIGHNFGRKHIHCSDEGSPYDEEYPYDKCKLGDLTSGSYWGLKLKDGRYETVNPSVTSDLMTYSRDQWVSAYTYGKLFEIIKKGGLLSFSSMNLNTIISEQPNNDMLMVRGFINVTSEEGIFDYFYHFNKTTQLPISTGQYSIELQNSTGKVLINHSFNIFNEDGSDVIGFVESMPYDSNTSKIVLKYKSKELTSVTVSSQVPKIALINPNGGETLSDISNITWIASDLDGEQLHYIVDYSPDNGNTWQTLVFNYNNTKYSIYTNYLQGTTQGLVRVTASDGVNTASDVSDAVFTVYKKPPEVTIVNPSSGTMITEGSYLTLTGAGYDLEDGMLNGSNLTWFSDINGVLGNGSDIWTRNLTRGTHNITLTAQDSDGNRATDQITISVIDSATIDTPKGTARLSVTDGVIIGASRANESQLPALSDQVFPFGVFQFNISHISIGQTVNVSIEMPHDLSSGARYWKYGKTIDNTNPHWYEIPMIVSEENRTATIRLKDGGIGDDDLTTNGVIVNTASGIAQDSTIPASVTNLHNTTFAPDFINWTWTNPPDADFHYVMLYLNGTFITNINAPQNYYNVTGLSPNTSYELGTFTVDTSGNINLTGLNHSARTKSAPVPIQYITVTSPNGGENWIRGTARTIRWNSANNPGPYVKIELLKPGAPNKLIIASTPNDGSHPWLVPAAQAPGNDYKVKITSTTNASKNDTSDDYFTIPNPSFTVVTPNGGENWIRGTTKTIRWNSTENPGSYVKIELIKPGVANKLIIASTLNDGSHLWLIPPTLASGNDYKVKITSTINVSNNDTSDNNFIIPNPSTTILAPNGDESWVRGTTKIINWTSTENPRSYVKIELIKPGLPNRLIVASTLNDGSHPWLIPPTLAPGNDYKVKITSTINLSNNDTSDDNFTIPNPTITVVTPIGVENWIRGTTKTINWSSTESPGTYVKIELLKPGVPNRLIVASTLNDGSHPWLIPPILAPGNDYKVKITSTINVSNNDTSDSSFTIPVPSINVVTPNGGENWIRGTTKTINWSSTESPGSYVKIELIKPGVPNRVIVASTLNDGSHPWLILPTLAPGNDYKVKITSTINVSNNDTSDDGFTIPNPTTMILAPNGDESWIRGTTKTIKWNSTESPGSYVKIELLKPGVLNRLIIASTLNDGSHPWLIPVTLAPGNDYKVKITSTINVSNNDTSDSNFTIPTPSITVLSPNGGENWIRGSTKMINWTSTESPGSFVKIELLKAGMFNRVIVSSTLNDGSHPWLIPATQTLGRDYKVKITSMSNLSNVDISDNDFNINI